jgi:hypothetical protein
VSPRAGLDAGARRKIFCPCRGSNLDRPARSQTLYCLSYRGFYELQSEEIILKLQYPSYRRIKLVDNGMKYECLKQDNIELVLGDTFILFILFVVAVGTIFLTSADHRLNDSRIPR